MSPFFSIIIPTKNRSQMVVFAIQSVLRQTYTDFEIILVDNDDSNATATVVESFRNDDRFKYYRTGNLSMADNWEFGIKQAKGTYITLLEDKQVLRKNALEYSYHYLRDEQHKVVTFPYSNMETPRLDIAYFSRLVPSGSFLGLTPQIDIAKKPFIVKTEYILNEVFFKLSRTAALAYMPRGITSFVHRSLIETIYQKPLGRLCADVTPDYVMAFQQLALVDEVLILPKRLSITGNLVSTGFQNRQKQGNAIKTFWSQLQGGVESAYNHVPIKALVTWNVIVNDFLRIKDLLGGNLANIEIPKVHYYVSCYKDIALSRSLAADVSIEIVQWEQALAQETPQVQEEVKKAIRPTILRDTLIYLGSLGYRLDVFQVQLLLKSLVKLSPVASSPIALLEWEEMARPEIYQRAE